VAWDLIAAELSSRRRQHAPAKLTQFLRPSASPQAGRRKQGRPRRGPCPAVQSLAGRGAAAIRSYRCVPIFLTYDGSPGLFHIPNNFLTYHGTTTITSLSRIISRDKTNLGFRWRREQGKLERGRGSIWGIYRRQETPQGCGRVGAAVPLDGAVRVLCWETTGAHDAWTQSFLGVGVFSLVGPHPSTPLPLYIPHVLYGERHQLIIKINPHVFFVSTFTFRICDCSVSATTLTTISLRALGPDSPTKVAEHVIRTYRSTN
jgi:hypothetical protein